MTKTGAVLNPLSYVPGVQLSGVISINLLLKDKGSTANLTIGGTGDAQGHLQISSGGHVVGALAGRHFATTVSPKAKNAQAARAGREQEWPAAPISLPIPALARIG